MKRTAINLITGETTIVEMTPEEIEELYRVDPPPVPSEVSDKQMLYWLVDHDKYQRVLEIINTLPDPKERLKAQIQFQRSGMIQRHHPMTLFVMNAIPLTPAETDQAFREMALISV